MQRFKVSLYDIVFPQPFDGSGNYNRNFPPGGWQGDATASIKIKADRHDQHDTDLATALSVMICKDGQSSISADIPWNSKKITGLANPIDPQDAATKSYVDNFKSFTTGAVITGADLNGRIVFSSPSGANGLAWTGADLSWIARLATTTPTVTNNRLALNDKVDGTGTDVITMNENGSANFTGGITTASVTSTGNVIGGSVVAAKADSGNVHFWFYGTGNVDRGVIYTSSTSNGALNIRPAGGGAFTFNGNAFAAPGTVSAGAAYLNTDGNIVGSIWNNLGYGDAYTAIVQRIESRAAAFANNCVQSTRMAGYIEYQPAAGGDGGATYSAYVVVMARRQSSDRYFFGFRQPQVYIPTQGWVAAFPF